MFQNSSSLHYRSRIIRKSNAYWPGTITEGCFYYIHLQNIRKLHLIIKYHFKTFHKVYIANIKYRFITW